MDFFVYYIVLTMSYCTAGDDAANCEPGEDQYYFQHAVHCEQVRRELSLMYKDYYENVELLDSSCEPLVVTLEGDNLPMWSSSKGAMDAAQAQMDYAQQVLGAED